MITCYPLERTWIITYNGFGGWMMRSPVLFPIWCTSGQAMHASSRHSRNNSDVKLPGACFLFCGSMHRCVLLSIHEIMGYPLLDVTGLYTRQPPSLQSVQYEGLGSQGCALQCFFFLLWALGSQFSFHHPLAHVQPFLHSLYLSPTLPPPLPPYIRPSSFPLAPMLMHFQSGCPLSGRALHVHQAVQSPACKWAQIASHCKLLEISLEGVL